MSFLQLAQDRYSVRKFSKRAIETEKLDKILKAGRLAPTAKNLQPQKVFVLKSTEALAKWDQCTACHYHQPVVILTAYDKNISWKRPCDGVDSGYIDGSIVTTHMMMEAADLGVGSIWIMMFDPQAVKETFGLSEDLVFVSALYLGYPDEQCTISPLHSQKKTIEDLVTTL